MSTPTPQAAEPSAGGGSHPVPSWVRWSVRAFLVAFVVCGLFGVEAWPLSGFRLFSHLRGEQVESWQPVVVDHAGAAADFSFSRLPAKDRNFVLTMRTFAGLSARRQAAVCRAWLGAMRTNGVDASELRLYLLERHLLPRAGPHPASPSIRTLRFTCTEHGVTVAQADAT